VSATTTHPLPDLTYTRPTQKTKLHNYVFDAFGPYPLAAGINQAENTPPEWKQGPDARSIPFHPQRSVLYFIDPRFSLGSFEAAIIGRVLKCPVGPRGGSWNAPVPIFVL